MWSSFLVTFFLYRLANDWDRTMGEKESVLGSGASNLSLLRCSGVKTHRSKKSRG